MFNLLRTLTALFVLTIFTNIQAVENVSSVNAYQSGKMIVITYELSQKSDITVSISIDGGETYHSLQNILGDFGKDVTPGNKLIYWDVLSQYDKFCFSEVCFKIESRNNGHEYVDLGLPSGTLWSTCNVGASKPEEYGDYFAWGETSAKSSYTRSNYTYSDNSFMLPLSDDAANVNWNGEWQMPTRMQLDELGNPSYTIWTWANQNGVEGYNVTSKVNGKSIFLPAAGIRIDSTLNFGGSRGYYLSCECEKKSRGSYYLFFKSDGLFLFSSYRDGGRSVRPVLNK